MCCVLIEKLAPFVTAIFLLKVRVWSRSPQNESVSPNGNNVGIEPVLQLPKPVLQVLLEDGAL